MIDTKKLRDIAEASTRVVAWYPHGSCDQCGPNEATVRGPFCRWFLVSGGTNGMGDPVKFPVPVADVYDDAKFAAAAMNNFVPLLDEVEKLQAKVDKLEQLLLLVDPAVSMEEMNSIAIKQFNEFNRWEQGQT